MADSAEIQADVLQCDNLKIIHGIGVGVEKRLNDAGIVTYAQLGEASPSEIAAALKGIVGYTVERIEAQDWVGQAGKLAQQMTNLPGKAEAQPTHGARPESHPHPKLPGMHQPYASFVLQFLLEPDDHVRRTSVVNVQTQMKDHWAGWNTDKLVEFLERSGRLRLAMAEPAPPDPAMVAAENAAPTQAASAEETSIEIAEAPMRRDEPGKITILDWRIVAGESLLKRLVVANQAFDFQLDIYFNRAQFPPGEALRWEVNLYARPASGGDRFMIGHGEETLQVESGGDETLAGVVRMVMARGALKEPGTYRIEAAALIRPVNPAISLRHQAAGLLEGVLVQTYDGV